MPSSPIVGTPAVCAVAVNGQTAAEPKMLMKSRRRIAFLKA
jgi:hypothetical protein